MALKKCFKLHKLFVSELERCDRIDREGTQVLSSLANVAKRVPLLASTTSTAVVHTGPQASSTPSTPSASPFGVLAFMPDTPSLLLEKHFVSMEKSATFLRDIVKDLVDSVRRMRGFVDEMVSLVNDVFAEQEEEDDDEEEEGRASARSAMHLLEWMENVRTMHEREALRKRLLVADVEYQDTARLQRMHREWPAAAAAVSFVDGAYVRMGTEMLPPLPVAAAVDGGVDGVVDVSGTDGGAATKKSKKKKAKAKQGGNI